MTVITLEDKQQPILLVDDDEPTLMVLRRLLEQGGYTQVESTTDPARVPEMFAKSQPRLVLLDLHMPQIDGLELMELLHALADDPQGVPFLVFTADETDDVKHRALALGARDFLTKPLDGVELLLRVRNLLQVQQTQDRLAEQNAHLERREAGLLRDLQAMQAALVPEVPARLGGLAVSVAYRPAEGPGAGGDFYDVFMSRAGKVVVVVGDVAGHDRDAMANAALTRYTLRTFLQAGLEPRAAIAAAGRLLVDSSGLRYATVAVGEYDARAQTLTYALAGHPPPALIDQACLLHQPLTVSSSPPLGWGRPTGRRQTRVSFAAGAQACFFSNGLIDARRAGRMLGREYLQHVLASLGPGAQADKLLDEVGKATKRTPDDMVACVLAPESPAEGERVHVEELEVAADTAWESRTLHFLRLCAVPATKIEEATEHARQIVDESGAALFRVQVQRGGSGIAVTASRRR